jgi:glucokinase
LVTVSTGIGGGIIVDGHVLRGRMGMAGHIGHLGVDPTGPQCNCGNNGCWESIAAGPRFAARARLAATATPTSKLHGLAAQVQPAQVFAAAQEGDALAQALVEEEAQHLGAGMTSLLHLFSPQAIIMGGGMSNGFDQLHPGIVKVIKARALTAFKDVPVLRSHCGDNAGLLGAAAMVYAAN